MYGKFKIMYSWFRNIFIMSNTDDCLSDETSEGLNESVQKVHDRGLLSQEYVQQVKYGPQKASVNMYKKLNIKYGLVRNMFCRSNVDLTSDRVDGYVQKIHD